MTAQPTGARTRPRGTARVLVVNGRDEVLVLLARLDDQRLGILTPGGKVEDGEAPRAAAVRELREETGIDVDPAHLHGPLHDGPTRWRDRSGVLRTMHATVFAVGTADADGPEVSAAGRTPEELDFLVDHAWLTPTQLAHDPRLRNPHLPALAARAVAAVRSGDPVAPTSRRTARVLPVRADGAVLLLQDQDPAVPGLLRWGTVGGAVDPGESLQVAVVREAFEETGLVVDPSALVGPVHRDVREFTYDGRPFLGDSTFFALALDDVVEVSFDHLAPEEVDTVTGHGWWTPDDLAADGSAITPDLPDTMRAAVAALEAHR
ncbi:NUDIX domain-containing protein [Nocardioides litoris]|uniref:NUDIX domain-containing protein n=1 Tax=Nocardioides litoris TaxID=1926648 RepID=UPI00111D0EE8|nr:NUDIX domain-containing protein [Nocardioides litoris]